MLPAAIRLTVVPVPMRCYVYKSRTRPDTYVYLAQKDGFEAMPGMLLQRLGVLEAAPEFDRLPGRKLARADADSVIRALRESGCYLQLPPSPFEPE